jgi:hypothetical protein
VRYASADAPGHIKYGEPIIGEADVDNIAELARLGNLEVRVLEGSDALSAKPTGLRE